jgi:hypothetical protein
MEPHEATSSGQWTAERLAALLGAVRFRPAGRAWRRAAPRGHRPDAGATMLGQLGLLLAMLAATGLLVFGFWDVLWRLGR